MQNQLDINSLSLNTLGYSQQIFSPSCLLPHPVPGPQGSLPHPGSPSGCGANTPLQKSSLHSSLLFLGHPHDFQLLLGNSHCWQWELVCSIRIWPVESIPPPCESICSPLCSPSSPRGSSRCSTRMGAGPLVWRSCWKPWAYSYTGMRQTSWDSSSKFMTWMVRWKIDEFVFFWTKLWFSRQHGSLPSIQVWASPLGFSTGVTTPLRLSTAE